jgi:hypothetical protein
MKKFFAIALLLFFGLSSFAQKNNENETKSEVKELTQFHSVIYKIWHVGWPKKDIGYLSSLAPEVDSGFVKIKNAVLPGIMRDRQAKWDEGVKILGVCVDMYKVSSAKKNSDALLNAAEKLHAQFENMVRLTHPPVKEVEEFHQVLYMLYHHYMPNGNYEKIKEAASEMKLKIDLVKKVELSKRLKSKTEKFKEYVNQLILDVNSLNSSVKSDYNKGVIDPSIEKIHSKYVQIEKLLE